MQIFLLEISLLGAVFGALSSRSKEINFNWLLLLLSCLLFPRPLFAEVKLDNSTHDVLRKRRPKNCEQSEETAGGLAKVAEGGVSANS